jgi:hypothetical protein
MWLGMNHVIMANHMISLIYKFNNGPQTYHDVLTFIFDFRLAQEDIIVLTTIIDCF